MLTELMACIKVLLQVATVQNHFTICTQELIAHRAYDEYHFLSRPFTQLNTSFNTKLRSVYFYLVVLKISRN